MQVLITGGSGFLGRHLIRTLQEAGFSSIRIFNRSSCKDLQQCGIDVMCGDLTDSAAVHQAVRGCEAVFHVAAKAGVWGSYRSYHQTNVVGTNHVLSACKTHKVRYLVYTSTPSVVYNGQPLVNVDERIPYANPWHMCAYAKTKMLAEKNVLAANDPNGLTTVALRPHLIWGPGDNHLIPTILKAAKQHRLWQIGDGKNWVDIAYVANVAQAHLLALKALQLPHSCAAGKAYFISQGEPVQLWPWLNHLLRRLNLPPARIKMQPWTAYTLGGLLEGVFKLCGRKTQPPMTRFVAKQLSQDHYFDISKAKMDLQYIPLVTTEEGVDTLVQWLEAHGMSNR